MLEQLVLHRFPASWLATPEQSRRQLAIGSAVVHSCAPSHKVDAFVEEQGQYRERALAASALELHPFRP